MTDTLDIGLNDDAIVRAYLKTSVDVAASKFRRYCDPVRSDPGNLIGEQTIYYGDEISLSTIESSLLYLYAIGSTTINAFIGPPMCGFMFSKKAKTDIRPTKLTTVLGNLSDKFIFRITLPNGPVPRSLKLKGVSIQPDFSYSYLRPFSKSANGLEATFTIPAGKYLLWTKTQKPISSANKVENVVKSTKDAFKTRLEFKQSGYVSKQTAVAKIVSTAADTPPQNIDLVLNYKVGWSSASDTIVFIPKDGEYRVKLTFPAGSVNRVGGIGLRTSFLDFVYPDPPSVTSVSLDSGDTTSSRKKTPLFKRILPVSEWTNPELDSIGIGFVSDSAVRLVDMNTGEYFGEAGEVTVEKMFPGWKGEVYGCCLLPDLTVAIWDKTGKYRLYIYDNEVLLAKSLKGYSFQAPDVKGILFPILTESTNVFVHFNDNVFYKWKFSDGVFTNISETKLSKLKDLNDKRQVSMLDRFSITDKTGEFVLGEVRTSDGVAFSLLKIGSEGGQPLVFKLVSASEPSSGEMVRWGEEVFIHVLRLDANGNELWTGEKLLVNGKVLSTSRTSSIVWDILPPSGALPPFPQVESKINVKRLKTIIKTTCLTDRASITLGPGSKMTCGELKKTIVSVIETTGTTKKFATAKPKPKRIEEAPPPPPMSAEEISKKFDLPVAVRTETTGTIPKFGVSNLIVFAAAIFVAILVFVLFAEVI